MKVLLVLEALVVLAGLALSVEQNAESRRRLAHDVESLAQLAPAALLGTLGGVTHRGVVRCLCAERLAALDGNTIQVIRGARASDCALVVAGDLGSTSWNLSRHELHESRALLGADRRGQRPLESGSGGRGLQANVLASSRHSHLVVADTGLQRLCAIAGLQQNLRLRALRESDNEVGSIQVQLDQVQLGLQSVHFALASVLMILQRAFATLDVALGVLNTSLRTQDARLFLGQLGSQAAQVRHYHILGLRVFLAELLALNDGDVQLGNLPFHHSIDHLPCVVELLLSQRLRAGAFVLPQRSQYSRGDAVANVLDHRIDRDPLEQGVHLGLRCLPSPALHGLLQQSLGLLQRQHLVGRIRIGKRPELGRAVIDIRGDG
mmetsp:Transcript_54986/g.120566  ORF Transcript_54986/g.120566 Transcript_54986/m.120566 type:complete len:378 (+) Transcript_54986:1689-2822(+)